MPNGNIIISINDRHYNKDNIIIQLNKLNDVNNSVDYYFRLATFEEYKFLCEYAESEQYPNINPYMDESKPFNRDSYYMIDSGIGFNGNLLGDNGYSDKWIIYPIVVRDFNYSKDNVYIRESDSGIIKLVKSDGEYLNLTVEQVKQLSEQLPLYVEVLEGKTLSKLQEDIAKLSKRLVDLNNNLDEVKECKKVSWFGKLFGG
jgi:hypothetical protein